MPNNFGKKTIKKKVHMIPSKIKTQCKRLKIKLSIKRGSKRVRKTLKQLKTEIKRKLKRVKRKVKTVKKRKPRVLHYNKQGPIKYSMSGDDDIGSYADTVGITFFGRRKLTNIKN